MLDDKQRRCEEPVNVTVSVIERVTSKFHAVVTVLVANNRKSLHPGAEDPNVMIGAMKVTIPMMADAVR